MTKRNILSVLMIAIGGLTSLSPGGVPVGLPLFVLGAYWFADAHRLQRSVRNALPTVGPLAR